MAAAAAWHTIYEHSDRNKPSQELWRRPALL
jgi:hypothetical protein